MFDEMFDVLECKVSGEVWMVLLHTFQQEQEYNLTHALLNVH